MILRLILALEYFAIMGVAGYGGIIAVNGTELFPLLTWSSLTLSFVGVFMLAGAFVAFICGGLELFEGDKEL